MIKHVSIRLSIRLFCVKVEDDSFCHSSNSLLKTADGVAWFMNIIKALKVKTTIGVPLT